MRIERQRNRRGLNTFVRTRYFYGQQLDVEHFESEQKYFNEKRWLVNRLVAGYGVVCGLDVRPSADGKAVQVMPGVAIDRAGREIVVPRPAISGEIPKAEPRDGDPNYDEQCDTKNWVHVSLCYHECLSGPQRVAIAECDATPECENGVVRERYEIVIQDGKVKQPDIDCAVRRFLTGGKLHYDELVRRISDCCPSYAGDCCIPLANVRKPSGNASIIDRSIDIMVRPIVYTNDLLFELICSMSRDQSQTQQNGKP